ncbi:MAG: 5-methyltetrahydropteroyltriglutamate--homocysteine methyltransferase [Halobacteria archaeon]|nr:5-methyltetrahydropteroyltriglutamate--homocysteine methyltransferase [Halobacteria archaeon]
MSDIVGTTAGYFPRPDYVIETLKEHEGHQKEGLDPEVERQLEETFDKGRKEVIEVQEDAGLELVTEGQLAWDDILAFPATRIDGIDMKGIIRFYDNNRYYRRPMVEDELGHSQGLTVDEYEHAVEIADSEAKAVMAGAYSLADLSDDDYYGDEDDYLAGFADVVNAELEALVDAGAETIQLDEPSLINATDDEVQKAVETVERSLEGIDAEVIVNTYFGDIADVYPDLLDAVDGIGIDVVAGDDNIDAVNEYGAPESLQIGCMNSRNTRLESVDELVSSVNDVLDAGSPETAYVAPSAGLDFLPWVIMEDKVERLGEATQEVR